MPEKKKKTVDFLGCLFLVFIFILLIEFINEIGIFKRLIIPELYIFGCLLENIIMFDYEAPLKCTANIIISFVLSQKQYILIRRIEKRNTAEDSIATAFFNFFIHRLSDPP